MTKQPNQAEALSVRQIPFAEAEYEQALKLRDEVLRRPLGMSIADDDLSGDADALHIGAFVRSGAEDAPAERLVGTLLLRALDDRTLQMKQVAVEEARRGTGTGRDMVRFAEVLAAELGYDEIVLHARENAVPFYEKLEYIREGERFEEIGIPHYRMRRELG